MEISETSSNSNSFWKIPRKSLDLLKMLKHLNIYHPSWDWNNLLTLTHDFPRWIDCFFGQQNVMIVDSQVNIIWQDLNGGLQWIPWRLIFRSLNKTTIIFTLWTRGGMARHSKILTLIWPTLLLIQIWVNCGERMFIINSSSPTLGKIGGDIHGNQICPPF